MPDGLENKTLEFIRRNGIFADAGGILVAVSGGADSIALLHVLRTLQTQGRLSSTLVCGHVNHQLRGEAGDADERFVVEQAKAMALPAVTRTVDVRSHAQTHRLSIETAARQLRLAALEQIARERGCSWIATGHQKNDNAETIIHRLLRGTGFRGLAGIRPIRRIAEDLSLARPLLCATRDEILRYLDEHNLSWREDLTNVDTAYARNYIRHRLLPSLRQESRTSLVEDLSLLGESAGRLHDRVHREAKQAWAKTVETGSDEVRIEASRLFSLPEPVAIELIRQMLVHLGCGERDLTERHYRAVLQLAREGAAGQGLSLPGGFEARCDRRQITFRRRSPATDTQSEPCVLTIPGAARFGGYLIDAKILHCSEVNLERIAEGRNPFCERLDWDQIRPPVLARVRQPGDRFQPLGQAGVQKVGKFLTAAKIPRNVRDRTIVFSDREKILWICPARIAQPARITGQTQRVLELTVRRV
ncbi:MAG: tRNA lysidine(34) synthetase TilS [Phycisphaerales bacterium]